MILSLDTNVMVDLINGRRPEVRQRYDEAVERGDKLVTCAAAAYELSYGALMSQRPQVQAASAERLLDNLERRGLIERREDETDRRARGIHLTRAGRDLAVRAARVGVSIQKRMLATVPAKDLEACQRALMLVERQLEERLDLEAPASG